MAGRKQFAEQKCSRESLGKYMEIRFKVLGRATVCEMMVSVKMAIKNS